MASGIRTGITAALWGIQNGTRRPGHPTETGIVSQYRWFAKTVRRTAGTQ